MQNIFCRLNFQIDRDIIEMTSCFAFLQYYKKMFRLQKAFDQIDFILQQQ
jgi:hypothetical protein